MYQKNNYKIEKIINNEHHYTLPWKTVRTVDIIASDNHIPGYDLMALNVGLSTLRQGAMFYLPEYYHSLSSIGLDMSPLGHYIESGNMTVLLDINTDILNMSPQTTEYNFNSKYIIATEYSLLLNNSKNDVIFFLSETKLIYYIRNYLKFNHNLKSLDDTFNALTSTEHNANNIIFYYQNNLIYIQNKVCYYSPLNNENSYFILSIIIWLLNNGQEFNILGAIEEISFINSQFSGINEKTLEQYIQYLLQRI